jgi:hypothetical protein
MKALFNISIIHILFLISMSSNTFAQTQNFVWGQRFGGNENDEAIDLATRWK